MIWMKINHVVEYQVFEIRNDIFVELLYPNIKGCYMYENIVYVINTWHGRSTKPGVCIFTNRSFASTLLYLAKPANLLQFLTILCTPLQPMDWVLFRWCSTQGLNQRDQVPSQMKDLEWVEFWKYPIWPLRAFTMPSNMFLFFNKQNIFLG